MLTLPLIHLHFSACLPLKFTPTPPPSSSPSSTGAKEGPRNEEEVLKGLLRLAHSKLQESQETTHTNSYIVDTTSKYSKCYFQCENGSSLLIKLLLKTLARLKVANLITSFFESYFCTYHILSYFL